MKLIKRSILSLLILGLNSAVMAEATNLNKDREQVIHQYIANLGNADYQKITLLFEKGGTVISTSRGNVDAKEFFYGFLPEIKSSTSKFHQDFVSNTDTNRYAARFHFTFKLKDGESGDGEYVDEFNFRDGSSQLVSVYMFENLKFNLKN